MVARAAERAKITTLDEEEIDLTGQLSGALRDSRIFEFRPDGEKPTIKGVVGLDWTPEKISEINHSFSDKDANARFRVKKVCQHEKVLREKFTLLSIQEK